MMLYGVFIPNDPKDTARVVLTMALGPFLVLVALKLKASEASNIVDQAASSQFAIANMLFIMVSAALAIYTAPCPARPPPRPAPGEEAGPVPARREAGRGGHGRGLHGRAPAPQTSLRPQADQARRQHEPHRPGPVRARGPVGGDALASQHDRDLRLRPHRRRHVLLRDGVPARPEPLRPGPPVRPDGAGARRLPDAAGLRGPRRGAPVRPGPSRPEAREHPGGDPGGQVRRRQGARLRPGQADRDARRPPVDGRLHRQRHAPVHVARAGDREPRTSTAGPTSTRWARSSTSC